MTEGDKLLKVKNLSEGESNLSDAIIREYLDEAAYAIYERLYPFTLPQPLTVPPKYERLQCRLAARYIARRGAEGETAHNENGVNRSYGSVNDEDLLMEIVPYAWTPGGGNADT